LNLFKDAVARMVIQDSFDQILNFSRLPRVKDLNSAFGKSSCHGNYSNIWLVYSLLLYENKEDFTVESGSVTENIPVRNRLEEKAICLVSGGIDSPVATWLTIRKGCTPISVYFDNSPFTDETTQQRAVEAIEKLKQHITQKRVKLYVIPHGADLADILRKCPRNLTCLLCKRMMYRLAELIALKEKAEAIITGEIIGEHASQTLRNLRVLSEALSKISIQRPLIGMNKTEVESLARKIGTFDISTKPALCCTAPPPKPRTRASLEEVLEAEKNLDIKSMIERDLKGSSILFI
jgi:thiamine biosynthesis protein ThiI